MTDREDMNRRLQKALEASRRAEEFEEIDAMRLALETDADGNYVLPPEEVPPLFFNEGPDSAAAIMAYIRHDLDPVIFEDHGAQLLREQVFDAAGQIDLDALDAFQTRYAGPLSVLPGLQGKIDVARDAQIKLIEAKATQQRVRQQVAASPANLYLQHDAATATKLLFELSDTESAVREILEWTGGKPEAIAGFRKAVTDHLKDEIGVIDSRAHQFLDFMDRHRPALVALFEPEQMRKLDAIGEDLLRIVLSSEPEPPAPAKKSWMRRLFGG